MIKATNLINTGIAWIPEIPSDWELKRIKLLFDFNKNIVGKTSADYDVLSLTTKGVIKRDLESGMGKFPASFDGYQIVKPNSIMLCLFDMDVTPRVVGHVDDDGIISAAYTNIIPKKGINAKYYYYYFLLQDKNKSLLALGTGIRITLNKDFFGTLKIPVPPIEVQNSIVAYLDKKNNEIDKFIRNKERLIKLLEEQKKNEVFNLISKGTFKHTTFKDSGIDWIGEIPANWQLRRFSWEVIIQEGPGIMAVDFRNEGVPLMRISGLKKGDLANLDSCNYLDPKKVKKKWNHFRLNKGDILISASASTDIVCEVADEAEGSIPYTGIIRLLPRSNSKRLNKEYLKLYISSKIYNQQVDLLKEGSTIQHYGPTHLKGFFLFLPSIEEQQEIVIQAKKELRILNLAISKAQKEISSIKEYREALITDLVTGKRSVPQLQMS